jgi:hypothetical protein
MLSKITDHAERAKARLLEQYRNQPKLVAFVGEMAGRVQELEDAVYDLVAQTAVSTAVGIWLDRLGAIVGEERGAEGDVLYRRYILARVVANRSRATFEDLVKVINATFGTPQTGITILELGRAALQVDLNFDISTAVRDRLIRFLASTRSAAVGQTFFWLDAAPAKCFTFSVGTGLEVDADAGFGDTSAPAVGGQFVGAYRA